MRLLNNQILNVHARLLTTADSVTRKQLRGQALQVLKARQAALVGLMQNNPRAALGLAFSPEALAELAATFPDSAGLLEQHLTVQGKVEHWIADYPNRKFQSIFQMNVGARNLTLHFAGSEPDLTKTQTFEVTGVESGAAFAVSSTVIAPNTTAGTTASTTDCSTAGAQNSVVLLATASGANVPAGITQQSVQDAFFGTTGPSLDGFWREASNGQTWASGDVFGWFNLPGTYSCSTLGQMRDDAIAAAAAAGVNFQNYHRLYVVVPDYGCGWAGYTAMSCSTISTPNGSFNATSSYLSAKYMTPLNTAVDLVAHEAGHQLGLDHAGTLDAGTETLGPLASPGTANEYGDWYSTMGSQSMGVYSAPHRANVLGWMTAGANYQVVQSSGSYALQPLELTSAGLQGLKVQRGTGNDAWLWIEYRQPIGGYDAYAPNLGYSGALIHYEDPTTGARTKLLDFTVGSFLDPDTDFADAPLSAGQTWQDPYSNLSITVGSATSSGLPVSVSYGSVPCTHANPTVVMSPADPSTYAGTGASYTLAVTNNDAAGCPASTFTPASTQPAGWSAALSQASISLSPGQSGSIALTEVPPSGTAAGTYPVGATASSSGYTGSTSANLTVVAVPAVSVNLSLPYSSYARRTTVSMTATVLNGSTPVAGASVTFTLTKANGSKATKTVTSGSNGVASWNYRVGSKDPTGTYSAVAQASIASAGAAPTQGATSNTITFTVQ